MQFSVDQNGTKKKVGGSEETWRHELQETDGRTEGRADGGITRFQNGHHGDYRETTTEVNYLTAVQAAVGVENPSTIRAAFFSALNIERGRHPNQKLHQSEAVARTISSTRCCYGHYSEAD